MRRSLVTALTLTASLAASSAALGGTISGQVFRDYNSNGAKNAGGFVAGSSLTATDANMSGVVVRAFDSAGKEVGQATTAADGTYSLSVSATGTVRVEFATPPGFQPSFRGSQAATSVQFVSGAGATNVNYAVNVPGEYCQDNPMLVTCRSPAADEMTVYPDSAGALMFPAAFGAAQAFSDFGAVFTSEQSALGTGHTTLAKIPRLGAVFGVGADRGGNAYFGTYVKRFSPYGPAGAVNAVYRVNIATGDTSTFATLGSATLPAHSAVAPTGFPPYSQDGRRDITNPSDPAYSNVYTQVGRAGLGDIDVSPDGSTLYAVEMTQSAPKLWKVPINGTGSSASAGTPSALDITAPTSFGGTICEGPWHPMGLGVRDTRVIVGGVCGGDESRPVDPATGRTEATAWLLQLNAAGTGFDPIAAFALDYPKGGAYQGESLLAWNAVQTGLWHNWDDSRPSNDSNSGQPFWSWGQPMLANIEILDGGDLALGFRDRFYDQVKPFGVIRYEWDGNPSNQDLQGSGQGAAEILRLCWNGSGYTRESGGACGSSTGANLAGPLSAGGVSAADRANSPLFYGASWVCSLPAGGMPCNSTQNFHPYTSLGGTTTMPGSPVLWSTTYDITSFNQQGVRALGPCSSRAGDGSCGPAGASDGAMVGGTILAPTPTPFAGTYDFAKGNGLGDLEMVCNAAPLQIGNRIWIDTNRNGIQDPDEPVGKGVTLRLYDAAGTHVGTALTDSDGAYYFASNVTKPVAGDGSNVGGGLEPGKAFTIKLNNAADFAAGGPLAGLSLTKADATSSTTNVMSTSVNSKATTQSGVPTITVAPHKSGFNDHTFDAGFVQSSVPVAMGDYTWLDTNRDGKQGRAEKPLRGVKVTLLNAAGTERARNRTGKVAPIATTNAKGRYLISNLAPGEYRARFEIPRKYCFTKPGAKGSGINSNPVPTTLNRRIGLTPRFVIYGQAKGDTTRFSRAGVTADFANLTIDAGVATCRPQPAIVTG